MRRASILSVWQARGKSLRRTAMIACAAALLSSPLAAQEVKLNEVLRSLFYAPQYVALRIGAFEQEGLKLVGPKTTWGAQAALTEIVSGNSNIALLGPEAAVLTQEASPDRRLVNFAQLTNGDGGFILSKTPMPNFTIADLKGKTIVTSRQGLHARARARCISSRRRGSIPTRTSPSATFRCRPTSSRPISSRTRSFAQAFEPMVVQAVAENKGHRVASVGDAARPDALYRVHGAGELHREESRDRPGVHQRRLQGTDLDRRRIRPRRSPS